MKRYAWPALPVTSRQTSILYADSEPLPSLQSTEAREADATGWKLYGRRLIDDQALPVVASVRRAIKNSGFNEACEPNLPLLR